MSLRKIAGLMVLSATLFGSGAALAQDATVDQVYQAIKAGRLNDAQSMMDKVLKDKPNSSEAHYVEAQLLAKEGNLTGAQSELATAERLNPAMSYVKASSVQELQQQISQGLNNNRAPTPRTNYAPPPAPAVYQQQHQGSGMPWGVLIGIVLLIVFIVVIARAFGSRNNVVMAAPGGGYGGGFGGGAPMGGGFGGGYPMGGGGIGSGIVGGLATGAALGVGMVAGEELVHHFTDGNRNDNYNPNQGGGGGWDNSPPANSDMGGNDFGISDGGSFDSGGGGGDSGGGGGDWN